MNSTCRRVSRQFGRQQSVPSSVISPRIAFSGVDNSAYKVVYETGQWAWNLRFIHSMSMDMIGPVARFIGDVLEDYDAWYQPRTHRFLIPQSTPDSDIVERMQRGLEHLTPWFDERTMWQVPKDVHQSMKHASIELGYLSLNEYPSRSTYDVGQGSNYQSSTPWRSWEEVDQ